MKQYKNIKEAHYDYNFPGSYRTGCIIKDNIVLRIYSNGISKPDYFKNNNKDFYYIIKSDKILKSFYNTKKNNKLVRVFTKINDKVIDHGLFKVKGFRYQNKYILLSKLI
jgi:hypothetical protein